MNTDKTERDVLRAMVCLLSLAVLILLMLAK